MDVQVAQYWHAETPPDYVGELLATVKERSVGASHRLFNRRTAEKLIADRFTPREVEAFRRCAVPAMQADYLRYCAVLALGGVYCDADYRCVGNLSELVPEPNAGRLFMRPGGAVINGVFAFGSSGHPFLRLALEIATANIENEISDGVYLTTGPPIFTSLVWMQRLGSFEAVLGRLGRRDDRRCIGMYCDTIGDFARIGPALDGVEVSPLSQSEAFLQTPETRLPYRNTAAHWVNAGEIFN